MRKFLNYLNMFWFNYTAFINKNHHPIMLHLFAVLIIVIALGLSGINHNLRSIDMGADNLRDLSNINYNLDSIDGNLRSIDQEISGISSSIRYK